VTIRLRVPDTDPDIDPDPDPYPELLRRALAEVCTVPVFLVVAVIIPTEARPLDTDGNWPSIRRCFIDEGCSHYIERSFSAMHSSVETH